MCGIAGLICSDARHLSLEKLRLMTNAITHRGPDGEGHWINDKGTVALGHRRLSIIDLSDCAAQPMHILNRYVIIFNGEIYNYLELKDLLLHKGYKFNSSSDTEVLALMYDVYKEECLQYFEGMFAFVIYDKSENKIFGARDRFGEKPFFYCQDSEGCFYFASEIKALWSAGVQKNVSESSLFNYLSFGYLQNPEDPYQTFYKGIYKLPAAHYFYYDTVAAVLSVKRYWDIDLKKTNFSISEEEAIGKLNELLTSSIKRRLRSDVPIGSSLSGGLDSSIIVSLMDQLDTGNLIRRKTFSASFPGFRKDEAAYQKIIIDSVSVDPYFVYPDDQSFIDNFNDILYHQDEPFASASINTQYEVFKKAKEENVTVLLDGQGADEIFAGYHSYFYAYFNELKRRGKGFESEYASYNQLHLGNNINERIKLTGISNLKNILPEYVRNKTKDYMVRLPKAKNIFSNEFYDCNKNGLFNVREIFSSLNEALYYSIFHTGLEELLRYADRSSMAHSREVRLPFLNHELVEFMFSLPAHFKIRKGWTKWLLRRTYRDLTDDRIIWRKDKIGYEPPQSQWMENNDIREKIIHNITKLHSFGILNKGIVIDDKKMGSDVKWRILNIGNHL